ncbi:MAG TPA: hypothetical protein VMF56_00845, partial [Acidobacteriaceae bacterium]|nr:hypothetical protein [Acidobacteriaceae bacterium]
MQRRDFCKLMAATAAAAAVPSIAQSGDESGLSMPAGFDKFTEDYAKFCATPADQRVFYAFEGGKIIQEKLDEKTWTPTGWGSPPALPISGG